ncbi:hypothetical protein niasHS_010342 [Heterodera schachtii]|uniref:Uncharacterized protein n=2 Tax=Heterodera TaxID=34509 RepID=A0ABD2IZY7_HETSC
MGQVPTRLKSAGTSPTDKTAIPNQTNPDARANVANESNMAGERMIDSLAIPSPVSAQHIETTANKMSAQKHLAVVDSNVENGMVSKIDEKNGPFIRKENGGTHNENHVTGKEHGEDAVVQEKVPNCDEKTALIISVEDDDDSKKEEHGNKEALGAEQRPVLSPNCHFPSANSETLAQKHSAVVDSNLENGMGPENNGKNGPIIHEENRGPKIENHVTGKEHGEGAEQQPLLFLNCQSLPANRIYFNFTTKSEKYEDWLEKGRGELFDQINTIASGVQHVFTDPNSFLHENRTVFGYFEFATDCETDKQALYDAMNWNQKTGKYEYTVTIPSSFSGHQPLCPAENPIVSTNGGHGAFFSAFKSVSANWKWILLLLVVLQLVVCAVCSGEVTSASSDWYWKILVSIGGLLSIAAYIWMMVHLLMTSKIDAVLLKIDGMRMELKGDIDAMRMELKGDMNVLRGDMNGMKTELGLRLDLVKAELNESMTERNGKMNEKVESIKNEVASIRQDINKPKRGLLW